MSTMNNNGNKRIRVIHVIYSAKEKQQKIIFYLFQSESVNSNPTQQVTSYVFHELE
jgi:hypothetical protein